MFNTLRECKSIVSHIELRNNHIDDACMKALGEFIKDNNHLEELNIGNNQISDEGIEMLSNYFAGNKGLEGLYINGNRHITDVSVSYLLKMIESSCIKTIGTYRISMIKKNPLAIPLANNVMKYQHTCLFLEE